MADGSVVLGIVRRLTQLTALGTMMACGVLGPTASQSTEPEPPVRDDSPVQTDSLVYVLVHAQGAYVARAIATYTNRSATPVFFSRCMPNSTEPMSYLGRTGADSTRRSFIGQVWACVGGVPTGVIPPGGRITAQVPLTSTDSPNANPPIQPEWRVGRFRVYLILCTRAEVDSDHCTSLPIKDRQSNAFDVRLPAP